MRRASNAQEPGDEEDETTSLLLSRTKSPEFNVAESTVVQEVLPLEDKADAAAPQWPWSTKYYILLCAFITSLSFGVTQVPLLYVFRLMTCDAYYADHPPHHSTTPYSPSGTATSSILSYALASILSPTSKNSGSDADRCSIHAIEASTALSIALLSASTTLFGLLNLFLTSSLIKRIGVKPTLLIQVFFPAIRLLVQNIGVEVWGSVGIIIVQCSQIVSVLGGPSGYLLALNTYITEVVEYEGRTAALGRLAGAMMSGSAFGFLLGGLVAEAFGIKAPFRLTLALFLLACVYVAIFLPHIPPAEAKVADVSSMGTKKKRGMFSGFFGPLIVFAPKKFIGTDGVVRTEYGAFLLAWGVFLGILATGYLPTLLQLYATDVFRFGTKQNGWLIFMYSMLRGVFLTFAFPRLIAVGRKWTLRKEEYVRDAKKAESPRSPEREPLLATQSHNETAQENVVDNNKTHKKEQTFRFDLIYTRFSLAADGLLTLLCSLVHEGWQMYLVAAILPFSAGTGSAAKGTVLQMVGNSQAERTDALAGVALVENIARLSTTFAFGLVFAGFASIGRTELVFTCNAAVALIGFVVLLFARFPLEGSQALDKQDTSTSSS